MPIDFLASTSRLTPTTGQTLPGEDPVASAVSGDDLSSDEVQALLEDNLVSFAAQDTHETQGFLSWVREAPTVVELDIQNKIFKPGVRAAIVRDMTRENTVNDGVHLRANDLDAATATVRRYDA